MINKHIFSLTMFVSAVVVGLIIVFSYLFFERYLTESERDIMVLSVEKFPNEPGKYFVFTPDEVFINVDNYYHDKTNADELSKQLRPGATYRVKLAGFYIPSIYKFRNIINVMGNDISAKRIMNTN